MNNKYQSWIKLGQQKGLTDIEFKIVDSTNLSLSVYNGKIEKNEISKMTQAVIKGIYNGRSANVKVENLSDENISYFLDELLDSAKHITASEKSFIYEGSDSYNLVEEEVFDFTLIDPERKVSMLLEIEKKIKNEKLVTQVATVAYGESESKTIIVNSKGLNLSRHHSYATLYASGVYAKDGQTKSALSYQIEKDFNKFDIEKLVNDNINEGLGQLGAKSIKSNKYPVVFSNEQFGNILSVYAQIFTGEAAFRNLTKLNGKQGEVIASSIVNLLDDPFNEHALFKIPFDDEGVACNKRHLIKDGKFTDFIHNLKTAAIFNTTSTGNGFSNSISPTKLVLETQDVTLEEVLSTLKEGIYITDLVGLHAGVESVSGNFSLQASGFEIKDGVKVRPVDMIVVSGNFFDLLANIEMIANDFKFGLSGVGTGSVKIKELTIAGE